MDGIEALYADARRALADRHGRRVRPKPFVVTFRTYAGLRGVIHDRGDHYEVRLSKFLADAPRDVNQSLARVLIGKIDRRLRATSADAAPYRAWSRLPAVAEHHDALRRARGRKVMRPPQGHVHDLAKLFADLNATYFGGNLPTPRLGWSPGLSRRLYGHHDPVHGAIVINRLLDHPRVPEVVVASILFHEMLHVKHGTQYGGRGRRILHPRALKREERSFAGFAEAKDWLRRLEARKIRLRPMNPDQPLEGHGATIKRPLQTGQSLLRWFGLRGA